MARKQRTVRRKGEISGVGLHSGKSTSLRIEPAAENAGVTFIRDDLPKSPRVPARSENLREMQRRTALIGDRDADVHTVEHFLACCTGLGIDNLDVFLDGPECPGVDGSARPFLELLESLGIEEQEAERTVLKPAQPISVKASGDATVVAMPAPSGLTASYTLDYGHEYLDVQHFSLRVTPETFKAEVAGARTFCLESEAQALRKMNLGLGATYENTLVVGADGPINNELRFPDEFARHKTLDLLGDLFLLGCDLDAHVIAYKSGHVANLRLVRALLEPRRKKASSLGSVQIRRILPHRYPFLLVDRVVEVDGFQRAVGIKNVSVNEPFFQGHYPSEPIMPGVLILEAMAQLAGILLLRKLELTGKVPVLLSIDRVKFRRAVVPGDQIRMEATTIRLSSGRGRVRCRSTVEGALVSEARLNFALTEPPSA
ncbi:MAG: UDP-3-O-acyl-N-acetylglucosamine deacetylase [Planctomycetota bacterium]|nr:UDP-3-O-acyl-N-acetylglucosamine deacetylase [Planctomycetota bacterium]